MTNLESMNKAALLAACKDAGIKNGSKMTVAEMRGALAQFMAGSKTKRARVPREERNGVKKPGPGACREVWQYLDKHGNCMPADLRVVAEAKGWNANNASIELYQWRKFNGITRAAKR